MLLFPPLKFPARFLQVTRIEERHIHASRNDYDAVPSPPKFVLQLIAHTDDSRRSQGGKL
ncbi:MAG: hypothetical protein DMG36_14240 [Acidobacteria bacterium]|nr:MAG: hypothetical protein DMG36_14240 [Acidobacteriota bacterium]